MNMLVKICGIKNIKEAEMAEKADFIGVVVKSKSRRCISMEKALEIINCFDNVILVSNSTSQADYEEMVSLEPAGIQIHAELGIVKLDFNGLLIKAIRVPIKSKDPEKDAKKIIDMAERYKADYYLLDSGCGTGVMHDLNVSRLVAKDIPVILAGGLTPENVKKAISFVKPIGVDVSSGVEEKGSKSREKIRRFIEVVKSSF